MKNHITKVIAVMMAIMMLVGIVPASALPEVSFTADDATSIPDTAVLGKDTVTNSEIYNSTASSSVPYDPNSDDFKDTSGNKVVHTSYSPYEPYQTEDEAHPFLPGNAAWIDLKQIYYGAPATPNTPIAKWSANTSVVNITGIGKNYADDYGVLGGTEIYAVHDMNLIDEYLWASNSATVGGVEENGVVQGGNTDTPTKYTGGTVQEFYCDYNSSAGTQPSAVKFYDLKTGKQLDYVWKDIDESDSAGNINQETEIFDGNDNQITGISWTGSDNHRHTYRRVIGKTYTYNAVEAKPLKDDKGNDVSAYVYNRYDAMQGKWGLTLDRNVSSVVWNPTWASKYFGTAAMNNSDLYLSDTPYLYYSTEAPDDTQIAISLLIGTPVQDEKRINEKTGKTEVSQNTQKYYEFRWYTITDNSDRPGVDYEATKNNSMVPLVTVSDVVLKKYNLTTSASDIISTIYAENPDNVDPIKVAANAGKDTETMYVDGAVTGCIDFTQLLPMLMSMYTTDENGNRVTHKGRENVKYKIAQVRVDTKTADGADDSAARINYMYFGPGLATVYTPQSSVGNDVNGANWMYGQLDDQLGDQNPNAVAKNRYTTNATDGSYQAGDVMPDNKKAYYIGDENFDFDSGYTNGWDNGAAVSIKNTPAEPQVMTIDTYGKNGGEFLTYEQYYTERLAYYQQLDAADGKDDDNVNGQSVYWLAEFTRCSTDDNSRVWKYTDANGVVQYLETEWNHYDEKQYIMVTVPIRKWVNVLGDSRKMSFKIDVLQDGKYAGMTPTFCMWGNNIGAIGSGHGDIAVGNRYSNEDMIAVFGNGYYQVDCSYNYKAAEIDKVLGNSTFYDDTDCWYDILQSPYVYDLTITDDVVDANGARFGYGDEMIGYTFITAIRFAVPAGMKFTVKEMKGDGNSAGLNSYSATGDIVNAFDGGTGVQPEIILNNSQTEYKFNGTSQIQNGTINGTQSLGAAAYGPMLEASYYTIYDLLDTERINAAGNSSHANGKAGQDQLKVYGQMWITQQSDLPIRRGPYTWATIDGKTYEKSNEIPVYATLKFGNKNNTSTDDQLWGVTGVVKANGDRSIGYVLLSDSAGTYATAGAGMLYKTKTYTAYTDFVDAYGAGDQDKAYEAFNKELAQELRNEWVISNFIGTNPSIQDGNGNQISGASGAEIRQGREIYNYTYKGPQLMYANAWRRDGATTCSSTMKDITFKSVNNTDMELTYTRKYNTSHNLSFGMTRIFDDPIMLHTNTVHQSFPVLYFDFTAPKNLANTTSMAIGLSVVEDGVNRLYYLDATDGCLKIGEQADLGGEMFGYFSFEDIIKATNQNDETTTVNGKKYPKYGKVEIVGFSIYFWNNASYTGDHTYTIRRAEIWQEETDWLDSIVSDNQHMGGNSSDMAATVKDSMNIITDAFYHVHDERNDGNVDITRDNNADGTGKSDSTTSGVNQSITGDFAFTHTDNTTNETVMLPESQFANMANEQFEIVRSKSYRKTNSNKGWSARIQSDTDGSGVIDNEDDRYFSYDFNSATMTRVMDVNDSTKPVYEFRPALGHLRVWVPAGGESSVVFESDRSFNTSNYRYLYYSYSMRDVESGISAEDKSADGKGSGVSVAIKGQQNHSDIAYLETDGSWCYYPLGMSYWGGSYGDSRRFNTTMNAALDLSTTDLDSLNSLVFYLRNTSTTDTAEFYINYIYLSNVEPSQMISSELEQVQTQYYYLMDNTGDRYSARFPTLDNPTGQVTGIDNASGRVNPVVVTRGARLSDGTYFNGQKLYGYDSYASGNTYKPTDDNLVGSMRDIMFYDGTGGDDITDYYEYKDRTDDDDDIGDIYDMRWSYGRWYTDAGQDAMNTMYVDKTTDGITGNLVRRYATENYVLLRAGITPRLFQTYFDANGGEVVYGEDAVTTQHLDPVSDNNYYINQTGVLSYFNDPTTTVHMKLTKPGFKFVRWDHYTDDGTAADKGFNATVGTSDVNSAKLLKFSKKSVPDVDYFKAVWEKDTETYPVDMKAKATFNVDGITIKPITVGGADDDIDENHIDGRFVLTFPKAKTVSTADGLKTIYGWKTTVNGETRVFHPGDKVYLFEDETFEPVFNDDPNLKGRTYTITLTNAKLYVRSNNGIDHPAEHYGVIADDKKNGTIEYSNVLANYWCIAKPINESATTALWTEDTDTVDKTILGGGVNVLGRDKSMYMFTASEDTSITYSSAQELPSFYTQQSSASAGVQVFATTTGESFEKITPANPLAREMRFVSHYSVYNPSNRIVNVLAVGTLYTKESYFLAAGADVEQDMRLLETDLKKNGAINEELITQGGYATTGETFRHVKASTLSDTPFNEYWFRVSEIKGNAATYYARSYVIYTVDGELYVAYGNVAAISGVAKKS